jgi:peptide deformylase
MDVHDAKTDCDTSVKRARDIASAVVISIGVLCFSTFAFLLLYTFVCSVILERDKYSCRPLSPNELYSILNPHSHIHTIYNDIRLLWIASNIDMKDACIMLAPYANHHVQLAIAKHDKSYEIIANPTYEVCDSSETRTVKEDSPLCALRNVNGKRGRFLVDRHTCIHASYVTIDNIYETKTLHDLEAYCYQHMFDVFNGKMPCDMITKSSMGKIEL